MSIENKYKKIVVSGKRKTAVARAMISGGSGKVTINGKNIESLNKFDRLQLKEPIKIAEKVLGKIDFDVQIKVKEKKWKKKT